MDKVILTQQIPLKHTKKAVTEVTAQLIFTPYRIMQSSF